ncbi:hypothetical protein FRC12_000718 [Ceratobasidium sp. 428]|nr:hypothetical protein FRC12_000718 [Ceratobasidium sp. 428]
MSEPFHLLGWAWKPVGQGKAETLGSEEVIELHAFVERREWIEEKIRLLEKMPPIEVFAGVEELVASSITPLTCLPSRKELAEWVVEHDRIERETEQFDSGDMNRLKKFTKTAAQRNLSREDTGLIEVTLTTLLALDRLIHLLRGRSESLDLMATRLAWEDQRMFYWSEREAILVDLRAFVANRAQWSPTALDQPPPVVHTPINRRHSSSSTASGMSGMFGSVIDAPPPSLTASSSTLSRGSRFMLGEVLSLDAAQFSTRIVSLNRSVVASGKTLENLIDTSVRKPVPDELLDEQDKIENDNGAMEGLGKLAMAMVMQWKKSDEIYAELRKNCAAAQALRDEVESAKLQQPSQQSDEAFTARASALTATVAAIGDPAASPSFPRPQHSLFPAQGEANTALTRLLSKELAITAEAIRETATVAAQYHDIILRVNEIRRLWDSMATITSRLEAIAKHLTDTVPSQDGDKSIPKVEDTSSLESAHHDAFLALLSATLKVHDTVDQEAEEAKAQCQAILLEVGGVNTGSDLKAGLLATIQQLEKQQRITHIARKDATAQLDRLTTAVTSSGITCLMLAPEIISVLTAHGCKNITEQLDLPSCSRGPLFTGGFGDVYRGKLNDGIQVAIKTMRIQPADWADSKPLKDAARELHTWSKCSHPNVLKLIGVVLFREQIGMVAEWLELGNIVTYIARNPSANRCQLGTQVCDGLSYLHSIGIIHGDLKGLNVLVASNGNAVLNDFGNAVLQERTLGFSATSTKGIMSPRWTESPKAPEIIEGTGIRSKAADVYALGMTILEITTGKVPYASKNNHAVYLAVAIKREQPARPEDRIPSDSPHGNILWSLLVECWAYDSMNRPSAAYVADTIRTVTQEGLKRTLVNA